MSDDVNALGFDGEDVLKSSNLDRVTTVERLASRDWSRDNIGERFREVRNNRDTIQSIIQDLMEDFEGIPSEEELDDQWGAFLEQKGVDADNKSPNDAVPAAYFLMTQRKVDALIRISVWQARLEELEHFALKTFKNEYNSLLEEYRTSESYGSMEDLISDIALTGDDKAEIEQKLNLVEKLMSRLFEQQKSIQKRQERLAKEDSNSLSVEKVKDGSFEALEEFTDKYGLPTLDPEELEAVNTREERDLAADSAADDLVSSDDDDVDGFSGISLKDKKSIEDRADALAELANELEPQVNDLSQDEIAEHTDMTRQAIFGTNGVLQKCHNNDLFPGIDV